MRKRKYKYYRSVGKQYLGYFINYTKDGGSIFRWKDGSVALAFRPETDFGIEYLI